MLERFQLTGKNAIVTGASGTIGGAMAEALVREPMLPCVTTPTANRLKEPFVN